MEAADRRKIILKSFDEPDLLMSNLPPSLGRARKER